MINLDMIIGGSAGLVAGVAFGYLVIGPVQYAKGEASAKVAIVEAMQKNSAENRKLKGVTDEEISKMSDRDLCIALGGLPDDCG